jgi:LacI family transcriptional regulator
VLVNRTFEDGSISACTVDDRHGSRLAVEHVVALGHERIGYVAGPQNVSTGHRRYLGFVEAMQEGGLALPPERVTFTEAFTEEAGAAACATLLRAAPGVTAIVTANDRLAIGCCDTLAGLGLICPDDISVVGFNDMLFIDRLRPPLTTVRVPQREVGFAAADMLLELMNDEDVKPRELLLEPSMVVRGSTAAPATAGTRR